MRRVGSIVCDFAIFAHFTIADLTKRVNKKRKLKARVCVKGRNENGLRVISLLIHV